MTEQMPEYQHADESIPEDSLASLAPPVVDSDPEHQVRVRAPHIFVIMPGPNASEQN